MQGCVWGCLECGGEGGRVGVVPEMQSEGYLKAPPSNLRALVKTTVLAGMFSPVENVSVANSTCNIRLDLTEQLQKSLGSMNFHAHAGYVLLLCYPSHLRCHTP